MAWHKPQTAIRLMLLALCLLLTGCSAPLLSQRQIVRGVFFSEVAVSEETEAVLLIADTDADSQTSYRTLYGRGQTAAEALYEAQTSDEGPIFYGLMDLVVLPASCRYEQVLAYADLLEQNVLPAAQMDIVLWQRRSLDNLEAQASVLYDAITAALQEEGMHSGLYGLTARANECALPVWQGTQFGFAWLREGANTHSFSDPLEAKLAAVLTGQTNRLSGTLTEPALAFSARTALRWEADAEAVTAGLTLYNLELTDLEGAAPSETEGRHLLNDALQRAFEHLVAANEAFADPLRLQFWQFQRVGNTETSPTASLHVRVED